CPAHRREQALRELLALRLAELQRLGFDLVNAHGFFSRTGFHKNNIIERRFASTRTPALLIPLARSFRFPCVPSRFPCLVRSCTCASCALHCIASDGPVFRREPPDDPRHGSR